MKVVIIDDDKSSGKALADLLETKYDMEVVGCALSGLDGLVMMSKLQPDVLFLDVQLPDVNGLDFLDKLSGFVHRRCQVVMYTAYDEYNPDSLPQAGIRCAAQAYQSPGAGYHRQTPGERSRERG